MIGHWEEMEEKKRNEDIPNFDKRRGREEGLKPKDE